MRYFAFRCSKKCTERLKNQSDKIFARMRSLETKNEQDVFLQSLITSMKVKTHRPRKEGAEGRVAHDFSFTYEVLVGDAKEKVCGDAFKSLYGIKISRIRRLRSLLVLGKSPKDLRGKKLGTNAIRGNVRLLINSESYPVKQSKYAGKTINSLDARLNVKILYSMFKEKHPEAKCSYKFFLGCFKDNFTLRFGRPQIDSCAPVRSLI